MPSTSTTVTTVCIPVSSALGPRLTFPAQGLYNTFIPLPLVHLTDKLGFQHVYIAPEAFKVAKTEFSDQIDFWQNALPGSLKGNLESVRERAHIFASRNS